MLHLDLLRHGETTLGHTLRGSTDDDLTELGWMQMRQTVRQKIHSLHVDQTTKIEHCSASTAWQVIFTSPLKRCRLFAEEAATQYQLPIFQNENLAEMHFGDWEAISTQQLYQQFPQLLSDFWQQPTQFTPPNAESIHDFHLRVLHAMQQIEEIMNKNTWQHALVVTHGGVIKMLKCLAIKKPLDEVLSMTAELGQLNPLLLSEHSVISLPPSVEPRI